MLHISADEIYESMAVENPWWTNSSPPDPRPRRAYFESFFRLLSLSEPRRSVILLGPRRVGKTVLIHQSIDGLIQGGLPPTRIMYLSMDRPLYTGLSLESIVRNFIARDPVRSAGQYWFFFDEIQYVRDWERELKSLTDLRLNCRFVASGSAAAALRAKSTESGAGRFTHFLLPPLTFDEFLQFRESPSAHFKRLSAFVESAFGNPEPIDPPPLSAMDIAWLNIEFENYLRFGGYPEAVLSATVQRDMARYIRDDVVDKVLLRDLPSVYGIADTRELNKLFSMLCYNTAQEVSLEGLSQSSAVAKNTLKRYIDYLEAAFLIRIVHRIDQNARGFQRQSAFKVYLTNPALRAALFKPIGQDDDAFGPLAETAVFSQWFHSPDREPLHYARWKTGEIDLVEINADQSPEWFVEVKWTDAHLNRARDWDGVRQFVETHSRHIKAGTVTSRSRFERRRIGKLTIDVVPTAIYAWQVGRNTVNSAVIDQLDLDLRTADDARRGRVE